MAEENTEELTQEQQDLRDFVIELDNQFSDLCVERHEMGAKDYGEFTWMGNDVVRMMIEELADTANYCRYQAIKLLMMQSALEEQLSEAFDLKQDGNGEITLGTKAFKGTSDVGWKKS